MAHTIAIDDRDAAFVEELVRGGRYRSHDEVLRESLQLMREREGRLAEFDALLEDGLASADAGRLSDAEEVFDRLIARYEAIAESRAT